MANQQPDSNPNPASLPSQPPSDEHAASFIAASWSDWSGPLPPPRDLAEYERAHPGLATTIVDLMVKESEHGGRGGPA